MTDADIYRALGVTEDEFRARGGTIGPAPVPLGPGQKHWGNCPSSPENIGNSQAPSRANGISESAFLAAVLALAKANQWRAAHFRPGMNRRGKWSTAGQGDYVGFPDVVLVRERLIVAELKIGKNQCTEAQSAWLAAFRAAGIEAYVWWPNDWNKLAEILR